MTVGLRAAAVALLLFGASAAAARDVSAPQAYEQATADAATLLDIRTPKEWQETGVAVGARRIEWTMAGGPAAFEQAVLEALGGDRTRPVALICRTGNRSSRAAGFLRGRGFTNVLDVAEGMAGSAAGPGWLRRGLPVAR